MLDDEAVENGINDFLVLACRLRNGLELQPQLLVERRSLAGLEREIVELDAERQG